MEYNHGISIKENPTTFEQPTETLSAIQLVFGTAPINQASDIDATVNKPILVRDFEEAKSKLGYSDDWSNYTLCQSMDASFSQFKVAPVIFVNVLDPTTHNTSVASSALAVTNNEATVEDGGVLLDTLVVKNSDGTATYEKDTDYIADFDGAGFVQISMITATSDIQVSYDKLDPSAVTNADVIGGYDVATDTYTGIEVVTTILPSLGEVPTVLLAPGWSHNAEIGAILVAKSKKINGSFNATNVIDVNGATIDSAIDAKASKGYTDSSSIVCWPKAKIGEKTYWYSAIVAASMARTDADNEDVPYMSPSNKKIPVSSMVNETGKEIYLDQVKGNTLNAKGIVTAINMRGWRIWGNNTAAYDADESGAMDPKDRFIAVRRMFDWWGNTFITNYFEKVDDPTNYRLIESVVDSENIRANGFQARGQIAGAKIEFRQKDNPISSIMDGKIQFIQKIGFLTPAEEITNVLEFDPTILSSSLFGGE